MQVWTTLIHVLQMLSALTMIGLVLIQHGKGRTRASPRTAGTHP